MQRRQRRWLWLAAAFVLLGVAAWLMARGDEERKDVQAKVKFPRHLRDSEVQRMTRRRTQKTELPGAPGAAQPPRSVMRDPVLAALPRGKDATAVVIEANAIRNSPIGQLLLDCLQGEDAQGLEDIRRETGIDPLQDLDRVMMWKDNLVLSGHFGNAQWAKLGKEADRQAYGDLTTIYTPRADGRGPDEELTAFAAWDNQLIVVGNDVNAVKEVIDRVEGRSDERGEPLLDESQTYGEIYGMISAEDLARMLPPDQQLLADKLRSAADQIELHVDTQNDVAISANITGPDEEQVTDLGKALGGALSLARLKAKADGDTEAAELLDYARVSPEGSRFKVEMALPLEALKSRLAFCNERRPAKRGPQAAEGSAEADPLDAP